MLWVCYLLQREQLVLSPPLFAHEQTVCLWERVWLAVLPTDLANYYKKLLCSNVLCQLPGPRLGEPLLVFLEVLTSYCFVLVSLAMLCWQYDFCWFLANCTPGIWSFGTDHDPGNLSKTFCIGLWFQKARGHQSRNTMAAHGRYGDSWIPTDSLHLGQQVRSREGQLDEEWGSKLSMTSSSDVLPFRRKPPPLCHQIPKIRGTMSPSKHHSCWEGHDRMGEGKGLWLGAFSFSPSSMQFYSKSLQWCCLGWERAFTPEPVFSGSIPWDTPRSMLDWVLKHISVQSSW